MVPATEEQATETMLRITLAHFIAAVLLFAVTVACAQSTADARAQLVAIQKQIQQAQQLYINRKYKEAGALITSASAALTDVPIVRDQATRAAKEKLTSTVVAAKSILEKKGVDFDASTVTAPNSANGDESKISFIKQIAPLLNEKCFHCHGGDETRASLRLVTYDGILRGGNNGAAIRPGNSRSLLVQRIKGEGDEEQMPPDGDPFTPAEIELIEKWIVAGAAFDGGDRMENIPDLITQFEVDRLSHEELWNQRAQLVKKNWDLGMPGITSSTIETKNLRLVGTSAVAELEKIGAATESQMAAVADALGLNPKEPMLKGGATIYIVTRRYDYSEFGKMVEQRSLPRESHGHWRYNGRDAYGVVLYNKNDSFAKDVLIAEQVAGLALASRGFPTWFAEGAGLAVAARLSPKDSRLIALRLHARENIHGNVPSAKFFAGDLSPEQSRVIGFTFVDRLMAAKKSWGQLMNAIQNGEPFNDSFFAAYRGSPEQQLTNMRSWKK